MAPRPLNLLRPIVHAPTVKYNAKVRAGRGFTLAELKAAKVSKKAALGLGIAVDHRRKNRSEEGFTLNVNRLKLYRSRLVVFPRNPTSKRAKKGDSSKEELAQAKQVTTIDVLPLSATVHDHKAKARRITKEERGANVAAVLRKALTDSKLWGMREKRAKDKADEAAGKKAKPAAGDEGAERLGGVQRPIRLTQQLAGEENQIRLAGADDVVGLVRLGNHADRSRRDARLVAHLVRQEHLVAGPDGNFDVGHVGAAGAIDQVHALFLEMPRERHRILRRPAAFHPIGGGDAPGQRQVFRPDGPYRARHLERKADAVGERAAVLIGALIGHGREKFVRQIAVRAVQFQPMVAGLERALRRRGEGGHHLADLEHAQRVRHAFLFRQERQRAGPLRQPAAVGIIELAAAFPRARRARLAAGVSELDPRHGALCGDKVVDAGQRFDLRLVPNAGVLRADPPSGRHRGGLADDQRSATDRPAAQVDKMPVVRDAIL